MSQTNRKTGVHSKAGKKRIAIAVSSRLKGKKLDSIHKKRISEYKKIEVVT